MAVWQENLSRRFVIGFYFKRFSRTAKGLASKGKELMGRLEVRGAPLFGASVSTEMLGYLCRQKALNFNIFVNQGPVNANTIANQFPLCTFF
jgi:hypothetical protein